MSSTQDNKPSALHASKVQVPTSTSMPDNISLNKWEDTGFEWAGEEAPSSFERLATILASEHEQSNIVLNTTLYRRNNVLHLAFTLTGEVWLTCQRCLQPIAIDLSDEYDIALLDNESQIRLVNEEQDYLLLDEIVTEQSPERLLPFKKLVEDEILLKTPMAPKHDDCEMSVEQFGEIPEEEETENPFAALASLKGNL
ncbi:MULTISPECIES: YceD family protein [unclassified Psychrobacter]|uniref:YceD family protein n=1 Tax=unclassified Psychrobacter TaxID=196806 RepID=UPI00191A8DA3|nr:MULTISPECIES: YceD family protein [unclassified Psychrobacter]|tara:strand:+ start:2099 stop:2692 length:594 start_codon:yes stop_codon:yes gene_type:complete